MAAGVDVNFGRSCRLMFPLQTFIPSIRWWSLNHSWQMVPHLRQPAKDKRLRCDPRRQQKWHLNPKRWLLTPPFLKPDRICGRCGLVPFRRVSRLPQTFLLPWHLSFPDTGGDACMRVSWDFLVSMSHRCGSVSFWRRALFRPCRRCHQGFVGMRCEHADLLAVVATNHRQTVTTVLALCVIGCVLVMVLCTLLQWVQPYFIRAGRLARYRTISCCPRAAAGGGRSIAGRDTRVTIAHRRTAYPSTLPRAVLFLNCDVISRFAFIYCGVWGFRGGFLCLSSGLRRRVGAFSSSCPNYKLSRWCRKWESLVQSGAGSSARLGPVWWMNLKYSDFFFFFFWSGTVDLQQRECVWLFICFCWASWSEEGTDSTWKNWRTPGH